MHPTHRTRFPELGFQHRGDHWRIVDLNDCPDPAMPSGIGPYYRSRAELLADLERFAASFGCQETRP